MEHIVSAYLRELKIPVSAPYVEKLIASHPDYPSLLSVADALERLGIPHQVGKIGKEQLEDLPFPYILHLGKSGGRFVLLKNQRDLEASTPDLEHWEGIVVKAEPATKIVDEGHNKQFKKEKALSKVRTALMLAILGLIFIPWLQGISWLHLVLLSTATAGTAVGYLLVAKELGITYRPVESFCNAGKRTNCDRILNAEEATLIGDFTFSDAVLSYFVFQLIVTGLFVPMSEAGTSFLWALAAAGMLAVPVIGYSVYYQYRKANTWCRLCLLVDGVLLLQVVIFFYMYYEGILLPEFVDVTHLLFSGLLFVMSGSGVVLLKERLKLIPALVQRETAALRVKHSPEVFSHLLFQGRKVDTKPLEAEMRVGNPEVPVHIVMAANLFCAPCKKAFNIVTQLIKAYPDKMCFSIRLSPGGKTMKGELPASAYLIRYWFAHIRGRADEESLTQKLIRDWYAFMNTGTFGQQYPYKDETKGLSIKQLEEEHYDWVYNTGITRTPTFYIKGYELPKLYAIKDLMSIIPGLVPLFEAQEYKTQELVG
ncbi:MAG: vitamin K epoxide reductase family protein [Balneolaceae bacterium]|nr:vitamin K epoxide reductase family protein [Balneolaceae bacterium]